MNWQFWKKEEIKEVKIEEEKVKIGSFLFATESNSMNVISVERIGNYTEVLFFEERDKYKVRSYHRYVITIKQHEDFVSKLSKEIKCIISE